MELTGQDREWAKAALQKTGLFSTCSGTEIDDLLSGLEKQQYRSGSTILFQGEISSRLSLVQEGTVAIVVRKGKEKNKVAELGTGSYFGEISLLTPRAATATVKAESDAVIISLSGEVVQALFKKNPCLADGINREITQRLEAQKPKTEQE